MNINTDRYVTSFVRSYKDSEFVLRLYTVWALAAIVVIGYFGIRPAFVSIKEKMLLINEMEQINVNLVANTQTLESLKTDIHTYSNNIKYLEAFMPAEPEVHSYILDLIGALGKHGFILRNLAQYDYPEEENAIEINVQTDGTTYPVELVNEIEKLKRITTVKNVTFTSQSLSTRTSYRVVMSLYIYTQPR
ncbi:hypothetical protein C4561_03925 [candidate division WWE3 bacterium]|jgi:Tfp pilus assembly protein PilO|uniref:Type 4a pilus biogenesis protein PilO n=1 Tax=candidate division WWE3 bacterium TaxID=2053526 RepID=A0A3A4ZJ76_UNCKA|nr:MAG: hypothetical protein C4561_03925 [candidate division WWE3 bacterium]